MSTSEKVNPDAPIYKFASKDGKFHREASQFRNFISRQPDSQFPPEKGRYHLYVNYLCPWAHRALLVRALKGLEDYISVTILHHTLSEKGWFFSNPTDTPGTTPDTVNGAKYLSEIYFKANPDYEGRYTIPVLWDKKTKTIVNNESSEIVRFLNSEFNDMLPDGGGIDLYPEDLRAEIDELNDWIYNTVNNGVYKSGFATTQEAYEENCTALFQSLDRIEAILAKKVFLTGDRFTEADLRLFDPVYHGHFKCNIKSIEKDYPNILRWARQVYQMPKGNMVNLEHAKRGYYGIKRLNPTGVVPLGNGPDLSKPVIKQ
ncbi:glutathione S-transferase [Thamnocephalis sphaerospora]|uniref:Glutathione S-transferase n=1 Tax=Thamnocephalis sphaerospora TaxID=78915 RepID=A0A4P9XHJ0_9FUNG|nr:glutathione S-transferase [Thamnocephalis sphaerospora]|eukprot:RKP05164.1 glutathione S-transferase [Thamnocephalis sphaerospora]